jgi:hypothetical protein
MVTFTMEALDLLLFFLSCSGVCTAIFSAVSSDCFGASFSVAPFY